MWNFHSHHHCSCHQISFTITMSLCMYICIYIYVYLNHNMYHEYLIQIHMMYDINWTSIYYHIPYGRIIYGVFEYHTLSIFQLPLPSLGAPLLDLERARRLETLRFTFRALATGALVEPGSCRWNKSWLGCSNSICTATQSYMIQVWYLMMWHHMNI